MFDWPEDLIPLPAASYSAELESSNVRSLMDSGRTRQRPQFTTQNEIARVRFELNIEQMAAFQSLWIDDLNMGIDWFTMRLPLADGETLTLSQVRFIGDYSQAHTQHGNWAVSADIEFQEAVKIDPDLAWLIIEYGPDYAAKFASDVVILDEEVEHFPTLHPWIF